MVGWPPAAGLLSTRFRRSQTDRSIRTPQEQTSEDQVEDGEQHLRILRERLVQVRIRVLDPFRRIAFSISRARVDDPPASARAARRAAL